MAAKKERTRSIKGSEGPTLEQVMADMNVRFGEGTMFSGSTMKRDPIRLPTGVFAVDYATGGGFPIHGSTCLWGPESSAKSTLAIKAMASASHLCWKCWNFLPACTCSTEPLKMRASWVDVEGTMDRFWAECLGASPETYIAAIAEYGEQYIDIAEAALRADDCGLLVIDSLAALVPEAEFDAPSEDQFMALQARMIGRGVRKLKQRMLREMKREHPCTIVFTNQMRKKIGVMFGDPETMSGGHGMFHEFSLILRCVKKALDKKGTDAKYVDVSRTKDMASRHSFSIRKEKMLTLAGVGEFVIVKEDIPEQDLTKGMIDDFKTVSNYAREYGVLEKTDKGYVLFDGKTASKLEDIHKFWKKFPVDYMQAQSEIIKNAKARIAGKK